MVIPVMKKAHDMTQKKTNTEQFASYIAATYIPWDGTKKARTEQSILASRISKSYRLTSSGS